MGARSYHLSIRARAVVPGKASGVALKSSEPLSFWGGYDARSGEILDRRHALSGQSAAGRVLVIPFTKGSSTTTQVLLEAIRGGHAPAAIVSRGEDAFLALASIVADEMYGKPIPILAVSASDFERLRTGQRVEIEESGEIGIIDVDEGETP
jgi:predicted aconitase with swiveling domain